MLNTVINLVIVALLWGATNPLIKKGTGQITTIHHENKLKQFLAEVFFIFTNVGYLIPMALNQLGSVLYFFALQNIDISLAVPVTNSLTFVFTALTGWFLEEGVPTRKTIVGMCSVIAGTSLMCYDKYLQAK
ncbi:PREDICTED: transmembrane protein 234 homolog [Nicrophorus vespilloides]|uniref:Transmembrane protein 234 homolog n=1 Tax=Nicrophorus vespilloides TaxID=110193 RepID=A0ABM1M3G9_NICVS|nr:PREDICTED: transmembrane protein 234 homolog [Nicrophorus vespilloides]